MGGSQEIETEVIESTESDGPQLAICLVSGGMDSCVTAAIAHQENDELAFLHVSYGQRTEKRERESFEALADHYEVKSRLVISLEQLARIGGSSLTDKAIAVTAAATGSFSSLRARKNRIAMVARFTTMSPA